MNSLTPSVEGFAINGPFDYSQLPYLSQNNIPKNIDILDNVFTINLYKV